MKKYILICFLFCMLVLSGCRESQKVKYNLRREADDFNIRRRITIINTRTDRVLMQMEGLISVSVDTDGDLNVTTEYEEDKYTLQFIHLSKDVTYLTEQVSTPTDVSKYKYEIVLYPQNIVTGFFSVTTDKGEQSD